MFNKTGPMHWELARQLAVAVATEGEAEPNVDPVERIRFEELGRIAEMHVREATGLDTSSGGGSVSLRPLGRAAWAGETLAAWQPLLDPLADMLGKTPILDAGQDQAEGLASLIGSLGKIMGPAMLGLQLGSAIGHLSRRVMGQYDFPIPRDTGRIDIVPANISAFAENWSLVTDDVRLWVCVNQITLHAVLRLPAVRSRMLDLLGAYVGAFRVDASGIEERLSGVDPTDFAALQEALADPAGLEREQESQVQTDNRVKLEAVVAAIEGFVDHVTENVGRRLIGQFGPLHEALRRQRLERENGEAFVEQLFGLQLGQEQFDRGAAFVAGVIERAGEEGLSALWRSESSLPTPAEVDAPGLWLERLSWEGR